MRSRLGRSIATNPRVDTLMGDECPENCLCRNKAHKIKLETRNATRLDRHIRVLGDQWLETRANNTPRLQLSVELITQLHYITIDKIYPCAGNFRTGGVAIKQSDHKPPRSAHVLGHVENMVEWVNASDRDPLQTAAYLLWRMNWIHPFFGGNGRVSRALTNLAINVLLGFRLPGRRALNQYIADNRNQYFEALREADTAWQDASVANVGRLTELLDRLLRQQLKELDEPNATPNLP